MRNFLLQFFTWWNGQTFGTRFYTWRKGERVGTDEFGNTYYRTKKDDKRWVIYSGEIEASLIPSGWHGWIHHRTDTAPSEEEYAPRDWEQPHVENKTGTPGAYHPPGSLAHVGKTSAPKGDYEAWTP